MNLLPKDAYGCPFLQLAPMEGVGDRCFRKAMASIGGFNEAVRDFLRVPRNAHVKSLAKEYEADELASLPLAAQLMGSDPDLMAAMAQEIQQRGAPRIDINCGCPSHTVTGRGAGSSLLKDPNFLHVIAKAVVQAVTIPVTLKMRSGYQDTSLFKENLLAAQESGVRYITLHPRTKVDGYTPPARWDLIAEAKSILRIPLVGNGDILNVDDALKMLRDTKCDALMIGRGSVINPFIFHQIRSHFSQTPYQPKWEDLMQYFDVYRASIPSGMPLRVQVGKLKQLLQFLFKSNAKLLEKRMTVLTSTHTQPEEFLNFVKPLLQEGWSYSLT
ncbi:MAG: tRNA-dihydrouridine synthase family protein [Verrucomicrobia bacterium]|nr:tRNA-dihydrouridine synthase family protein [Verrucomicrobiota bacterium]MBS0645734.1 tRNA-dihydrouridine synthase family protein [Verrucomicrobiota bacterium]